MFTLSPLPKAPQHQSLTFFLHDPLAGVDYSYANGVVEKLEITMALKKFIEFNASIQALSGAAQSTFSPSTTAEHGFVPQYLVAGFAPSLAGVQGTLTATGTCLNDHPRHGPLNIDHLASCRK